MCRVCVWVCNLEDAQATDRNGLCTVYGRLYLPRRQVNVEERTNGSIWLAAFRDFGVQRNR